MIGARALEQSRLRVRRLAKRHPDAWGGEDLVGEDPLQIYAAAGVPRRVLVVTSAALLKRWVRSDWPEDLVVVLATGILTRTQAAIIGALASDASVPIAFVGDAGPMGLHTYLSLRVYLGPQRVRFCGICDAVLDIIGDGRAQPETLSTWELSVFDKAHLRVVVSLAKPVQVLGPRVAAILGRGRKISIVAIGFRADLIPAMFKAALKVAGQ